jgi:hypothetical protein
MYPAVINVLVSFNMYDVLEVGYIHQLIFVIILTDYIYIFYYW